MMVGIIFIELDFAWGFQKYVIFVVLLKNVYKKLIATNIRQRAIKKTLQPAEVKEKIQIKRDYKKKDTTGGKY